MGHGKMKMTRFLMAFVALVPGLAIAGPKTQQAYAIPPMDAPSLAALGAYGIGTRSIEIASPGSVMLSSKGVSRGGRVIKARIWYPAKVSPRAVRTSFSHILPRPDGKGLSFTIPSLAVEGGVVLAGQRYPLVIVSHGYNGWDTFMTWLTENLATKGYFVVAIDHDDQRAVGGPELAVSFGNVLINRAADQRAVIDYFTTRAAGSQDQLGSVIDAEHIGVVGFSMGGFGALATAGMDYDPASSVFSQLPAEARAAIFANQENGRAVAARVKAVVTLAPFGGRPDSRVWTGATVANFGKPVLMIDGSEDDIVDVKQGVTWIFDQMASNDRHFLLFQNARHNVGGNPPPPEADGDFSTREYFAEPVWRTERINAINQHFITAFFDLNLKGDQAKSAYLNVAPVVAGDGQWPLKPLENVGGRPASDQEPGFWRGFQRRWALGLEMRSGQPAKTR
jgi:predicted dienelactone hydrolase